LNKHDWSQYENKTVALYCSADAIIPNWAYMLVASKLNEFSAQCIYGNENQVREKLLLESFAKDDLSVFANGKILVKGCGSFELSPEAYVTITNLLQPIVSSLMFGEACSSVPVFKSKV